MTCHRCSKKGHFQLVCRAPPQARPVHLEEDDTEPFVGEVTSRTIPTSWTVMLELNGTPTDILIDTGAKVTVISEETHRSIGGPPLTSPCRSLKGPSNHSLPVKGYTSQGAWGTTPEKQDRTYMSSSNFTNSSWVAQPSRHLG